MAKFAHKLVLPKIVLAPLLAHFRSKNFGVTSSLFADFSLFKAEGQELAGEIKTGDYTFKLRLKSYPDWQLVQSFLGTEPIRGLLNGNFEPELAELMRTDKSFVEAVKRLQALWKLKGQPLEASPEEAQFSPRYNLDGSEGQLMADIPNVARPNAGE